MKTTDAPAGMPALLTQATALLAPLDEPGFTVLAVEVASGLNRLTGPREY